MRKLDPRDLTAPTEFLVLIGTLALPLFGPFLQMVPGINLSEKPFGGGEQAVVIMLFAVGAAIGLRWNWRRWLPAAAIFWGVFTLMYTAFFTNFAYFQKGVWETVAYWIGEHETKRGGQPGFYYLMVIPVYEFLPVIFAAAAGVYYALKDSTFVKVLLGGVALSFILYASLTDAFWGVGDNLFLRLLVYAAALGLMIYGALKKGALFPRALLVLAGLAVYVYAHLVFNPEGAHTLTAVLLCAWAGLSMVLYVYFSRVELLTRFLIYWSAMSLIIFSFYGEKMPWLSLQMALPAILLGGLFIGRFLQSVDWKRWRKPNMVHASILLVLIILFSLTAYVGVKESYQVEDEPAQMLIYCGLSYDVKQTAHQIYAYAEETGQGKDLPVAVAGGGVFDNGWRWYLLHQGYKVIYYSMPAEPRNEVLILGADVYPVGNESWLEYYQEPQELKLLIWFPEVYKMTAFSDGSERGFWDHVWWWMRYAFARDTSLDPETPKPYWPSYARIYFPKVTANSSGGAE